MAVKRNVKHLLHSGGRRKGETPALPVVFLVQFIYLR